MLSPATLASVSAGSGRIGHTPSVQPVRIPPVAPAVPPVTALPTRKPAGSAAPAPATPPLRGLPRGSLLDLSV
ncbi:hypothetical protein [Rhodopila sp.]|uniref:hypothetical protein n=1 Tax=Rhodopila sp. TaxID=2480087 RepID=UPI003D11BEA2